MVNTPENPPLTAEQQAQLVAQTHQKTKSVIIQEFINIQNDAESVRRDNDSSDLDKIKTIEGIPNSVKDKNNNRQKLQNVTDVVKQTFAAIQLSKRGAADMFDLPTSTTGLKVLETLASSMNVGDINEKNSLYLYEVIRKANNNELNDAAQFVSTFESIKYLQYTDKNLHRKISETFQSQVMILNIDFQEKTQVLSQLKTDDQKQQEKTGDVQNSPEIILQRAEKGRELNNNLRQLVDGSVTETALKQSDEFDRVEKRMKRQEEEQLKQNEIITEIDRIKNSIIFGFEEVKTAASKMKANPQEVKSKMDDLRRLLKNHYSSGLFDAETYKIYTDLIDQNEILIAEKMRGETVNQGRGSMLSTIQNYDMSWNQDEQNLILALDDPDQLVSLAQTKYGDLDEDGWKLFQSDIKQVFERMFEVAQSRPNDFWSESFSMYREDPAFKSLISQLNKLSESLGKHAYFRGKKVIVDGFTIQSDPLQLESAKVAPLRQTAERKISMDFSKSLETIANEMIDLKNMMEYTHNINVISNQGLGFDKIAEYSAKVDMRNVDSLFYKNQELVMAYNMYIQNMYQEFSLNYHIMPTDFGNRDKFNLDSIEWRTYRQLAASGGIKEVGDKKLIRMIRLASGLAKGVFGEYWGAALTARLPMEIDYSGDKPKLKSSFQSMNNAGLEKMLLTVDLDLLLQRYNLPRYWPKMRYAFAPRDFNDEKVRKKYHDNDHADIYKFGDKADTAWFNGRDNELAEFDDDFAFLSEHTRTSSIDMFLRGAWRFQQIRRFYTYEETSLGSGVYNRDPKGKLILNYETTLKKLQGIGPFAVKMFIDDFFEDRDWSNETSSEAQLSFLKVTDFTPDFIKKHFPANFKIKSEDELKKMTSKEIGEYFKPMKKHLYKTLIFDQLAAHRLTQFIAMESPRFMPEGETRLTSRMELKLNELFAGKYKKMYVKDHLMPMFIGALELTENEVWKIKKDEWRKRIDNNDWIFKDAQGEEIDILGEKNGLKEIDFDDPKMKEKLINYYHLTRDQLGAVVEIGHAPINLNDEEFLSHVKIMFKTLREGINDTDRLYTDRLDKVGGDKQELTTRYANLMAKNIGYIDHYLKGNLFDFSEFYIQQSGSRSPERMWGEVAGIATKMTPALRAIFTEAIPELVKKTYANQQELEQAIDNTIAKPFKEYFDAISGIDTPQALGDAKYLVAYIAALVGKDRMFRTKLIGSGAQDFARRMWGTQASFMTDHFKSVIDRPTTAFDSEQIWTLTHKLLNMVNIPIDKKKITGYKEKKNFLGVHEPISGKELHNLQQVIEVLGVTKGERIKEAIPMLAPIILLILFMLAKMALDKDKKK
ncbi:MAG: hypothetical protein Q7R95_08595 [bacterium]|nr:hypothetical protein [bacterium]